MAADDLATSGARASAAMILIQYPWNIHSLAQYELKHQLSIRFFHLNLRPLFYWQVLRHQFSLTYFFQGKGQSPNFPQHTSIWTCVHSFSISSARLPLDMGHGFWVLTTNILNDSNMPNYALSFWNLGQYDDSPHNQPGNGKGMETTDKCSGLLEWIFTHWSLRDEVVI